MRNIKLSFGALLAVPIVLWAIAETELLAASSFLQIRSMAVQLTGVVAISCMSVAMMLALRPRWPEHWLGGLDKMYRLHKWLGIAALVASVTHWAWTQAPKWASGLGLIERGSRPSGGPAITDPVEALLGGLRGPAESVGEWAFYAFALLVVLALVRYFPYRLFFKTHRLLAVAYLVLVFHTVVLTRYDYWTTPLGVLLAALLVGGTIAAVALLLRLAGMRRQVWGHIGRLEYYPGVRALEVDITVSDRWPGHKAGQFAFAMTDPSEGPHPYTISSDWHAGSNEITFIAKELGDHTRRLHERLQVGQQVRIEGPYGAFTFDDGAAGQIWIAGGIGITPFIARMHEMAVGKEAPGRVEGQTIDLFHTTSEVDDAALGKLAADARSANVRLHLLIDGRDGRLTGERLRNTVTDWATKSVWFCGPTGFGEALKQDLAAHGFPVGRRFHQELFAMR